MSKTLIQFVLLCFVVISPAYAINSSLVQTQVDLSGKVTTAVFERIAGDLQQHFVDFAVEVPPDFVVIGGGAEGSEVPQGNLLTASYPNADLSAWLVSSKDHLYADAIRIKAYAIGLKIAGLTRQQLISYITVNVNSSGYVQHPDISVGVQSGFKMVGGGFKVNWYGAGNLATASYPETSFNWRAQSKDHLVASPATLQVYAVGLLEYIPNIGQVVVSISSAYSAQAQHPSSTANVVYGYALSGCGAKVNWSEPGNLLWKLVPSTLSSLHGCTGASKDHGVYSPATITTSALGIRIQ